MCFSYVKYEDRKRLGNEKIQQQNYCVKKNVKIDLVSIFMLET